ncbi:MAG: hydrogenase nickel incorporation protein HypB [Bdellovibrionaceae bacterium]|nr:hydrogenase nickel incorporation protein HypB [Pseudobdellovibrionaceae bacterium]
MCQDCGCEIANKSAHGTLAPRPSSVGAPQKISLEHLVLAKNNLIAASNRKWFSANHQRVLNLISSPGTGKTLLLEKTIERLPKTLKTAILTGDQERDFDAQRLLARGANVRQLNTLSSCHLDASMIAKELGNFVSPDLDLLIIENVGNLVCPAAFDIGEDEKVALLSTTEGEDKPSKYPLLFHEATLIVITKMDLVPHLDWDLSLCLNHIRKVNSKAPIITLSAKSGDGMDAWIDYLTKPSSMHLL